MVFLRKEFKLILKSFWPRRSEAKGFSIENLARRYRERISSTSSSETLSELVDDRKLKSLEEVITNKQIPTSSLKRVHWANRDFSEYREVA